MKKIISGVGVFIIVEALLSILLSQDQMWYSTGGRILRVLAGAFLLAIPESATNRKGKGRL
jgi:hypothetical protein